MGRRRFEPEEGVFKTDNNTLAGYLLLNHQKVKSYEKGLFIFYDDENMCKVIKRQFERII